MSRTREIFARKLIGLMLLREWSNADLARRLSTAPSNVTNWLKAKSFPRDEQIDQIAAAFGIEVGELFSTAYSKPHTPTDHEILSAIMERFGYYPPKSFVKKKPARND